MARRRIRSARSSIKALTSVGAFVISDNRAAPERAIPSLADGHHHRPMGFIKDAKVQAISNEAQKAYANGDWYFTPVLNSPMTRPNMTGNVHDWALMLQAIVSAGWTLQFWNVGSDKNGKPEAYPLFVRTQ